MERIKKKDTVVVISGKDKGKKGSVIDILPKKGKILISGVALATKHVKARKQGDVAGIKKEELYIGSSKVMPLCPSCGFACRVGVKGLDDGKSVRVCKKCKEVL